MKTKPDRLHQTFDLVLVAFFVALTVVSARLSIRLGPIPITLQTLVVLLSGALLGPRRGWMVPALYLVMGLLGLPFFANGGGLGYLAQPTFGFLIGFIPGAWLVGWLAQGRWLPGKYFKLLLGAVLGMAVIYGFGFAYIPTAAYFFGSSLAVWGKILAGLPLMVVGDLLKIALLVGIVPLLSGELEQIRESLG